VSAAAAVLPTMTRTAWLAATGTARVEGPPSRPCTHIPPHVVNVAHPLPDTLGRVAVILDCPTTPQHPSTAADGSTR